ncbi:CPBP family intramembrane glutamic endopeptidase [Streptomyces shenzhenensis]|uniref:CPBP family intramembrane glutamic endopeptidase n=1 Tax=Streptomyces shenzhenensis TaxID=943815 RepID=UPI0033F50F8A
MIRTSRPGGLGDSLAAQARADEAVTAWSQSQSLALTSGPERRRTARARVSVLAGATVFALAHGLDPVPPVAFVIGAVNAPLLRRTGPVRPSSVVHGIDNALAISVPVMVTSMARWTLDCRWHELGVAA